MYLWHVSCSYQTAQTILDACEAGRFDQLASAHGSVESFRLLKDSFRARLAAADPTALFSLFRYVGWGASFEEVPNLDCRALKHLEKPKSFFGLLVEIVRCYQPDEPSIDVRLSFVTSLPYCSFAYSLATAMFAEAVTAIAARATPSFGAGNVLACGQIDVNHTMLEYVRRLGRAYAFSSLPASPPSLRALLLNKAARMGWACTDDALLYYIGHAGCDTPEGDLQDSDHAEETKESGTEAGSARTVSEQQRQHRERCKQAQEAEMLRREEDRRRLGASSHAPALEAVLDAALPGRGSSFAATPAPQARAPLSSARPSTSRFGAEMDQRETKIVERWGVASASSSQLQDILVNKLGYPHLAPLLAPYLCDVQVSRRVISRLGARQAGSSRSMSGDSDQDNLFTPAALLHAGGALFFKWLPLLHAGVPGRLPRWNGREQVAHPRRRPLVKRHRRDFDGLTSDGPLTRR